MTIYQELQLNQAGSKMLIRQAQTPREKFRHTAVYLLKICITMIFCMAFVIGYSKVFGDANSIVGVVVLLCIMVFRFADFGIQASHGLTALMLLGCHNVIMANHSTLVLGYLLLYGYDVTGKAYAFRLAGLMLGAVLTGIVYYRNHGKRQYKRDFRSILGEFQLFSARTRWQLSITLGVSSILFLATLMGLPRAMWAGIAAMSVLLPFREDVKKRVKGRIPGNLAGGLLFLMLYPLLPEAFYPYIGVAGGIGVGLSATYGWQAVFNSLGAMAIAVSFLGVPGAVFFRVFNNVFGALYGLVFEKLFHFSVNKIADLEA